MGTVITKDQTYKIHYSEVRRDVLRMPGELHSVYNAIWTTQFRSSSTMYLSRVRCTSPQKSLLSALYISHMTPDQQYLV